MKNLKSKLLAAVAASGAVMAASQAKAAFTVTLSPGVVSGADTYYNLTVLNTGGGTGTLLSAIDITLTNNQAQQLVIGYSDTDGDGVADANVFGSGISTSSVVGSWVRLGGATTFAPAFVSPSPYDTDPGGTGAPTQSISPLYSATGVTNLEIAGTNGNGVADSATALTIAHIVVPTGDSGTILSQVGGDLGLVQVNTLTYGVGGGGTATHALVSLTAIAPTTGYGSQLTAPAGTATFTPGTATSTAITVAQVGGPTSYVPGFAHVTGASGTATAYAQINLGAAPVAGASEIYGLQLEVNGVTPTPAQIAQIITDINAQAASDGGIVASTPSSSVTAAFGTAYNLELVGAAASTTFLGFDFSQESNVSGVTVAAVAAVPEPATAVGLLVGAGSLLLGRRKNRVA